MRTLLDSNLIASTADGASSWAEFLSSFRETAADQLEMLPAVGFGLIVFVMIVLNWKIAKRLSKSSAPAKPKAGAGDAERRRAA